MILWISVIFVRVYLPITFDLRFFEFFTGVTFLGDCLFSLGDWPDVVGGFPPKKERMSITSSFTSTNVDDEVEVSSVRPWRLLHEERKLVWIT
jgi:hypothetical protein